MSISTITSLNEDALSNQWEIIIPPHPGQIDQTGENFRITNVGIPERLVSLYTVHYKSQKFTKYGGKDETANEFSFDFRVDKYYQTYQGFSDWHKLIINPITGAQQEDYSNGTSSIRVPITILTVDPSGTVTSTGWKFEGCFPSNVPAIDFNYDAGDPLVVSITMQFITVDPLPT